MKKIFNIFIILIILFVIPKITLGQQNPQFSQYLFNGVVINPAYAGSKGYININGLYRKQWTGLDESPSSQTLSADGPISGKSSWGGFFSNDKLGFQRTTSLYAAYAYRIALSKKSRLSLGVSGGVVQYNLEGDKLITDVPDDPAVPKTNTSVWSPDARVGLYFYTQRFFLGVSMWEILSSETVNEKLIANPRRHFYLASGVAIPLSDAFVLRPSIILKEDFKGPSNGDLTAFLIFKDKIWLGGSYRAGLWRKNKEDADPSIQSRDAISAQIQVFPIEQIRIGYAYDFTVTSALKKYPTHEISFGYYIRPKISSAMLSPRYF